ncbi:hypothetical protein NP493_492g02006 [Ridgeia piscesae]|uniref:Uncharacterized protein n=1 Tax=Ridgeia piscesae TaxID=27915 RepID=A0AAD9KY03_RIDPI|nr:hypothetical protein NP493_492g02006 [Ridgeia piscesae]
MPIVSFNNVFLRKSYRTHILEGTAGEITLLVCELLLNVFVIQSSKKLDSYFNSGALDDKEVIGKLNAHLFSMFPRFGTTSSKRDVGAIPRQIFSLNRLEHLSLKYQGFTSVPDAIGRLSNLHHVYLSHNPLLTNLSAKFGSLPLKHLDLTDCPSLKTPPREITTKGFQATYAFLKRLQTGSVTCKRTKLMLVGLGGAGKTR